MKTRDSNRIFLSASTGDFGATRLSLREALARSGFHVIHQADFPQTRSDTVLKLAQLIEPCGLLVHLIGRDPGSVANKRAVDEYLAIADKGGAFLQSLPDLRAMLGDFSGITYTQWEVLIALNLSIPVFVYADATIDEPAHPQRRHLDRLAKTRRHAEVFTNDLDLHKKIQADLTVHLRDYAAVSSFILPTSSFRSDLPTIQRFFGRDTELAKLLPDLHPDATGWGALIDGPGGMGKTTLAIRAAELAAPGHYDDILFLSAKQTAMDPHGPHDESPFAVSGFTQMLDAIARRLQKPEITQAPADERPRLLIDALTATRTLLVLDNLETLTDADQRSLFAFLGHLPRTCKALLTSRPLIIATGRRLKLQQLDQTAALQTLADIARDNPALAAAPEPALLRLIIETGGNTLLLTWTAWQVGSGYCTSIADALAHLRSCPQGNDPLEFIFGDLLARFTPEEERIIATLSYPTEPIPVTAIAEISGVDEPITHRVLKLLTNRSIVVPQEGDEKYALVPMVAEFIRHARRELVERMGQRLADRAVRLINENGHQKHDRFPLLESSWPTVNPAIRILLAGDNARLQSACNALLIFLSFQGRWDERLDIWRKAEALAIARADYSHAARRAFEAGGTYCSRGQASEALSCADRADEYLLVTGAGNRERALVMGLRFKAHVASGNKEGLVEIIQNMLNTDEGIVREFLKEYWWIQELIEGEKSSGDLKAATRDAITKGLNRALAENDTESIAIHTCNLAELALENKDCAEAESLARKALQLSSSIHHQDLIAHASLVLSQSLMHTGAILEAQGYAKRAFDIYTLLNSPELTAARGVLAECEAML